MKEKRRKRFVQKARAKRRGFSPYSDRERIYEEWEKGHKRDHPKPVVGIPGKPSHLSKQRAAKLAAQPSTVVVEEATIVFNKIWQYRNTATKGNKEARLRRLAFLKKMKA